MKLYSDFGNLDRIPDGEERKLPTKASDIGALSTSGGTLTGSLYLKGNPTQNKEAATKEYVDNAVSGSEQVQSNWQENDSTQKSYVQNRTHWKETQQVEEIDVKTQSIDGLAGDSISITHGTISKTFKKYTLNMSIETSFYYEDQKFYIPKSSEDSTMVEAKITYISSGQIYVLLPVDTTILPDGPLVVLNYAGSYSNGTKLGYTTSPDTFLFSGNTDLFYSGNLVYGIPETTTTTTYHKLDTNYIPWDENPNPGFEHPIILEENTDYGTTEPASPQTGQVFFNTGTTLADLVYPIGAVYISINNTSPATLFGGTWQKITEKFLLSSSTNYPSGSTGGEATHKLTQSELPYFEEPVRVAGETAANFTSQSGTATGSASMLMHTASWQTTAANPAVTATNRMYVQITGGNEAHNNMPPYMVVNMWYRTA